MATLVRPISKLRTDHSDVKVCYLSDSENRHINGRALVRQKIRAQYPMLLNVMDSLFICIVFIVCLYLFVREDDCLDLYPF